MQRTAFFDLGNVILFFNHEKMYKQIANLCSLPVETVYSFISSQNLADRYERGDVDTKTVHALLCGISGEEIDYTSLLEAVADIFVPNESIIPILETLKKNNTRLILLSNTCEAHFEYAHRHYPQLHLFDDFILSYKVGARKPEEKIFKAAISIADVPPQNCFYTDDIPEYIESARRLGIDGETFLNSDLLYKQLKARQYF